LSFSFAEAGTDVDDAATNAVSKTVDTFFINSIDTTPFNSILHKSQFSFCADNYAEKMPAADKRLTPHDDLVSHAAGVICNHPNLFYYPWAAVSPHQDTPYNNGLSS
jgi:hypothetical protein